MLISIWNYLRGYVIIEISGFSIERFLNLAINRGVYIWNIQRYGNKLSMSVGIAGYKMLKPCARKAGCSINIKNKMGLPFITYKYRKRKMIPLGILIFIILIYGMSSFVWLVEVEGNNRVPTQTIIEELAYNGYKLGGLKYKMDLRKAEQVIMKSFPDILWTGISFEGTKLIVRLTEIVEKPKEIDYTKPCSIVAKSDALILNMITRKGTPKVRPGDTVRKGDVLVSGELTMGEEEVQYVHASADIIAKTHYTISTQLGIEKVSKKYTGNWKKTYNLLIFGKNLKVYNPKIIFKNYDHVIKRKQFQVTSKFPLPFYWGVEEYIEYIPEKTIISEEDAQDKLTVMLYDLLKKNIHEDGEVLNQEITFKKEGNRMIGKLQAIVKEEVGNEILIQSDNGRN